MEEIRLETLMERAKRLLAAEQEEQRRTEERRAAQRRAEVWALAQLIVNQVLGESLPADATIVATDHFAQLDAVRFTIEGIAFRTRANAYTLHREYVCSHPDCCYPDTPALTRIGRIEDLAIEQAPMHGWACWEAPEE